jgi:hypothetical protein
MQRTGNPPENADPELDRIVAEITELESRLAE